MLSLWSLATFDILIFCCIISPSNDANDYQKWWDLIQNFFDFTIISFYFSNKEFLIFIYFCMNQSIRNFLHLFLRLIELLTQFCYIIDNWCWWYVMGKKSLFCFAAFQPENKSKVSPENFCLSRRVRICD